MNTPYDVAALRRDFPILSDTVYGKPLIYFDNAASSQAPRTVIDEIDRLYLHSKANVHRGVHCLSQKATGAMEASRERVRDFIGAESSDEIIFTRGTTEAINLVASSYGSLLSPGDEIILTQMEHHSNIVPWQLLEKRAGIVLKVVPVDDNGVLDMDAFRSLFSERTRLVSVCHVSNVLGTVNPVAENIRPR